MLDIHFGDNLDVIAGLEDESIDLIYIDPPFNTGRRQTRRQLRTVQDDDGDRTGFKGKRYRTTEIARRAFDDAFDDYLAFLLPRFEHACRLLKPTGSFFLHIDYREVHYLKVLLDSIFGRDSFINEIIWAYDYGARTTKRWSPKHDNILWYAKDPEHYTFNYDAIDRIPYMAPGLVGPEKAARGKTPTDTWWHTIVSPSGKEKTGYPTQKPLGILNRIVAVHSNPGDTLLDFFAGSGTLGEAAARHDRHAILVDNNPQALDVMRARLAFAKPTLHERPPTAVPTTARTKIKYAPPLSPNLESPPEPPQPRFTPLQGSYLAYIHNYTVMHGRPPAEADMRRFFKVTPPSVHQMVLALEKRGLITRIPGAARSICVLVDPRQLPRLR